MKKPVLFIGLNVFIIATLSFVQVVVANSISTTGIELGKVQQQIDDLKKKNAVLHEQVLLSSSLTHIASEAASMGLSQSTSKVVLSMPLPLALR